MKKLITLFLFILFFIKPLSAFSDTEEITIQLNWKHQFEFAGFYAAQEKGFFADEGLKVILKERTKGLVPVDEVLEERADYGIWVSNLILDRMKGKPVVILSNYFKNSPLVILSEPSIRIPSQLKGKKVMGISEDSMIAEIAFMLMQNGISIDELNWVPHSYDPFDILTPKADAMSAYITNQPYMLKNAGKNFNILDPANYGANFYGDSLFTSEKVLNNHKKRTIKLINALNKGWEYALENPEEIIDIILKKYSPSKSADALRYEALKTKELIQPDVFDIGSIDPLRIQSTADFFIKLGLAENKSNLSGFILNESLLTEKSADTLNLNKAESEYISKNPVVKISNKFDFPPFDYSFEGKPQGFGPELMETVCSRVGLTPEFINFYTWNELITDFYSGKTDVIHSINKTSELLAKANFSEPYYKSKKIFVYRKNQAEIKNLNQLEDKIIAVPKRWSMVNNFQKKHPKIHFIEVENPREALEFVDQEKVYAAIENLHTAQYIIESARLSDLAISANIKNKDFQQQLFHHFAVKKDNQTLINLLNKGYESISDEEIKRLENKWLKERIRASAFEDSGLSKTEREYLKNKKEIKFSIAPHRLPIEGLKSNELSGMSSDFIKLFSEKLNVKFTLVKTSDWEETQQKLKNKEIDIIPMINRTDDREKYMNFSPAYMEYVIGIIVRQPYGYISDVKELKNKRIALVKNSHFQEILSDKIPGIKIIECANQQQAFIKVSESSADAAFSVLPVAGHIITHLGLNNLKVGGILDTRDQLSVSTHIDDKILDTIMTKVVRSISSNEINQIREKWAGVEYAPKIDYDFLVKAALIVLIIFSAVLVRNRKLVVLNRKIKSANTEIRAKSIELERISNTDNLTGLANKKHINESLDYEIKRVHRYNRNLSMILADLDFFKTVNDKFGHQAGDKVLATLASVISINIRKTDIAGRWGGEEFLIICPETDLEGAHILAENLRKEVEKTDFSTGEIHTLSIGVSSFRADDDADSFLERTDKALYSAKENGRNNVQLET